MDAIDLKLITLLQKNARTPLKILANQVFLSSPATAARIEKLEKEGIIGSYTANVDLKKAGFPIIAFIQLDLDPKLKPTFYPFIQSHRMCLNVTVLQGAIHSLLRLPLKQPRRLMRLSVSLTASVTPKRKLPFQPRSRRAALGLKQSNCKKSKISIFTDIVLH